jgi:hypothetical protein
MQSSILCFDDSGSVKHIKQAQADGCTNQQPYTDLYLLISSDTRVKQWCTLNNQPWD